MTDRERAWQDWLGRYALAAGTWDGNQRRIAMMLFSDGYDARQAEVDRLTAERDILLEALRETVSSCQTCDHGFYHPSRDCPVCGYGRKVLQEMQDG